MNPYQEEIESRLESIRSRKSKGAEDQAAFKEVLSTHFEKTEKTSREVTQKLLTDVKAELEAVSRTQELFLSDNRPSPEKSSLIFAGKIVDSKEEIALPQIRIDITIQAARQSIERELYSDEFGNVTLALQRADLAKLDASEGILMAQASLNGRTTLASTRMTIPLKLGTVVTFKIKVPPSPSVVEKRDQGKAIVEQYKFDHSALARLKDLLGASSLGKPIQVKKRKST